MAKVRSKVKFEPPIENMELPKVVEKKLDDKKSISDSRFERHKVSGDLTKRNEISEKVKQGLLRWAFYGIENDNGYQYYRKLK